MSVDKRTYPFFHKIRSEDSFHMSQPTLFFLLFFFLYSCSLVVWGFFFLCVGGRIELLLFLSDFFSKLLYICSILGGTRKVATRALLTAAKMFAVVTHSGALLRGIYRYPTTSAAEYDFQFGRRDCNLRNSSQAEASCPS